MGQIDNLYRRVVHILIPKGESSGQYVENSGFNASAFCLTNELWYKCLKEKREW